MLHATPAAAACGMALRSNTSMMHSLTTAALNQTALQLSEGSAADAAAADAANDAATLRRCSSDPPPLPPGTAAAAAAAAAGTALPTCASMA